MCLFHSLDDVLIIHQDPLDEDGGIGGIHNIGLLESAISQPRQQFGGAFLHGTMGAKAAAYLFHIVQNHPFNDGNKRCGTMAALVFLDLNGVGHGINPRTLESVTMSVASSTMSKGELIAWFNDKLGK